MTKFFIEMKWRNDVMSIQLGMRKSLSDNIILVYFFRIARIHCGKKYTQIRFFLYTAHFSREICAPRIFSSLDILSPVIKICRYSQHILSPQSKYCVRDLHHGTMASSSEVMTFTIFLGHIYSIIRSCEPCPGGEQNICLTYINITLFTPKVPPLIVRVIEFTIFCPYTCYKPNMVKIDWVVLEEKMLMQDGRQRMPTYSNRSPMWLRWP